MKSASVTFRTTPEFKAILKKQPKMSAWIEDACLTKLGMKPENVLQSTESTTDVRQIKHPKKQNVRQSTLKPQPAIPHTKLDVAAMVKKIAGKPHTSKNTMHIGSKRVE